MTQHSGFDGVTRFLLTAAALVVILWGIALAQSVLILLLVACFMAIVASVPAAWMERKGLPTAVAILIVMGTVVGVVFGIGAIVGASLNSFSRALPFYQTRVHDMLLAFRAFAAKNGLPLTDRALLGYLNPGTIMNITAQMFASLSSVLSSMLIVLFTVIFILLEASTFPVKLRSVLDNPQADFPQFTRFVGDISHYMVLKTILNLIAGVLIAVWLAILGVDYPVLWGFLVFVLHFIPSIGSVLAAIPAVTLAFVQLGGGAALLSASGYLVIGTVLGNVVEPKIMGRRFGLSPLVIFVSLIIWGSLLGVVGALLCVPLTISLKLVCETREDLRWLAVLLGSDPAPAKKAAPADTAT